MAQLADGTARIPGDNEMAWRTKAHDWAATPLGPRAGWPAHLEAIVAMALANDFPMGVLWGPQFVQIYNDGYRDMLGERHPAALGQSIYECFPELRAFNEPVFARVQAGQTVRIEDQKLRLVRHGSASDAWFTVSYSPLRDEAGQVAGILITALETTARVRAEEALRLRQARQAAGERSTSELAQQESDARFQTLADAAPALIWHNDAEGRNLFANRHFVEFSGSTAEELRGTGWYHLMDRNDVAAFIEDYRAAVVARQGWSSRIRLRRHDGAWRWFDHSAQPLLGADGTYLGHVGVSVDTTDMVEAEAALCEALLEATESRHQAELANAAKDDFLAVLGHELRTPLAAITLWTAALRSAALPADDLKRAIQAIADSAQSQSRLVDDLIDLSRLTLGRLELRPEPTDVARLLRASVEVVKPIADSKRLALRVELDPELGSAVLDGERLKQIVWNLLNNATKFTPPEGSITVAARRLHDSLELEVRDTGAGISPEYLPRVFERFSQEETGIARPYEGLGIGLALARELAELHGGDIQVDSAGIGQGTVIRVHLPWMEAEGVGRSYHSDISELSTPSESAPISGLRLLLIEDEPNTLEAMRWLLEHAGATVTAVSTVTKAVDALATAPLPDVVISDLALPDQPGASLLQHLQASAASAHRPRPPCCAVSAHARDSDRNEALQAGFDMFLKKPVAPARLIEAIAELHEMFGAQLQEGA